MRTIPVTILAGADLAPARMPASGAGLHPLAEYKAVALAFGGRPIVAVLVERLARSGGFGPIAVAGPARLLAPLGLAAEVVDTDGSVGVNARAAIEAHRARHGPEPMALLASDVLPSVADLAEVRARYEEAAPCALWFPFVRVPAERGRLGSFAWKPTYRLRPAPGAAPLEILPGHLAILAPETLRLPLLYRLIDAAYRTRNLSIRRRRLAMLRTTLLSLLALDLAFLLRARAPTRTVTVLSNGLSLARQLRSGHLEVRTLETLVGRIFLRERHACAPPALGIHYPVLDLVRLAQDVDTQEEAHELGRLGAEEA